MRAHSHLNVEFSSVLGSLMTIYVSHPLGHENFIRIIANRRLALEKHG